MSFSIQIHRCKAENGGQSRNRRLCCASSALAAPLFGAATLAVMPLYTLMLVAPRARLTLGLMSGLTPFVVMAMAYVALLADMALGGTLGAHVGWWSLQGLAASLGGANGPGALAATWVHLLTLDLFVAREVYLEVRRLVELQSVA